MSDLSLCALSPKPLAICANCRRNPEVTEPGERQCYIAPEAKDGCDYWWPVDSLEQRDD